MHDYQMVLIAMSATNGASLRPAHQRFLNRTSRASRQHNHETRNAEVEYTSAAAAMRRLLVYKKL
jgi:hypothetical protein